MKVQHRAALSGADLALCPTAVSVQVTDRGLFDQGGKGFPVRAAVWQTVVMNTATWSFWMLGTISLVWMAGK